MTKKYDYLLVEGAGGITCPLILEKDEKYLLKDLIWELGLSTLVVADAGLGTINSTLLTVEYAESNGIEVEGVILNNYDSDNFMHWDNLEQVEKLTGVNVVATVPKGGNDIVLLEGLFKG
jgi:dethiobiotin synthetase